MGQVEAVDQRRSSFDGELYPIVTIAAEEGSTEGGAPIKPGTEKQFHAFHTVPRNELYKVRPQVGERLGVAYYGKGQKAYERYRVVVDRPKPAFDWDAASADASPAAGEAEEAEEANDQPSDDEIPF